MRNLKLKLSAATAAIVALAASAFAGQPVTYTFVPPNIPGCSAPNAPTNIPVSFNLTSAGGASVSNLDTVLQSQFTIYESLPTKTSGGAGTVQGQLILPLLVSPDNVTWYAGPIVTNSLSTTNGVNSFYVNVPSTTFRFVGLTNVISTATNSAIWQSNGPSIQFFWKTL